MTEELSFRISEPKFSEPIEVGSVFGKPVTVCRPLNEDAFRQMDPVAAVLLVMHDHLTEMQKQIDELKAKLDDAG